MPRGYFGCCNAMAQAQNPISIQRRPCPTHSEQGDTGIDRFGHFAGLTTSPQFLIWPVERCARASCCAKGRGRLTEISGSTASSAVRDNMHETASISSCALEKRAEGGRRIPYRDP